MSKKITYRCPKCGSTDITSDACARWDDDAQEWELSGVQDHTTCQDCGYESDYGFEVELEALPEVQP